jgi:hypothetical protein
MAFSGWLQFSGELDWWSTHITALRYSWFCFDTLKFPTI